MARHHPNLDFSKLDMEEVEKEILAYCPFDATTVLMDEDETINADAPTDPSPSDLSSKILFALGINLLGHMRFTC